MEACGTLLSTMKKHPIATVVNFCSNESRFIKASLEQASLFSSQVIVPVCDHFFDGTPENRSLLEAVYAAFPNCLFVEYPFVPEKIPRKIWRTIDKAHFWHSLSRLIGFSYVNEEIDSVLFIDADEVPDAKRFSHWLDQSDYHQNTAMKLANYWYFRDPSNQAEQFEDSIVLAQRKALELEILLHQDERDAIYNMLPNPKRRKVTGSDGKPMFHHYSWVRTQEEMLQKVQGWGHKKDRDWKLLVNEEFQRPFSGTDFVHGYTYRKVEPQFDIKLEVPIFLPKGKAQLVRLKPEDLLRQMKVRNFWYFF